MASWFVDASAPRFKGPPSEAPRGLVRPPQVLQDRVAQDRAKHGPMYGPEYAKLILDDWTLAYYFEGQDVAYRSVPEGVEVLAVGSEIEDFLRTTTPEQRVGVHTKIP